MARIRAVDDNEPFPAHGRDHDRHRGVPAVPTNQNMLLFAAIGFLASVAAVAYWVS